MKTWRIIKTVSVFFLGPGLFSQAQDTAHISLSALLQLVEANYPAIMMYQPGILALDAKTEGATSWMPPEFSTGFMRFPYDISGIKEKEDPMNQAGIAFSIEQMIPNNSKLKAKKNYLNSLSEIEKTKREWTKNELRREAKILYYNRFVNEKKARVIAESEELLSLVLSASEAKFSSNQSQLPAIYKAKARLAELKNMQYMLSGLIAESNIGLNTLMVREINSAFSIDTLVEPKSNAYPAVDTNDVSKRSDISTMSKYIQSMQLQQKAMEIGNRPEFGIRAEHAEMFGMPNQWSLMGMITFPVPWSVKMVNSETKSMGYQIQSMELERQTMELMAKRMLVEKGTMLNFEIGQYENYKKDIIPAFENNLQANLLAFRQNTGDFFILLDAWEMLLMKKMEMYEKLFSTLKLEAEYEYERETK